MSVEQVIEIEDSFEPEFKKLKPSSQEPTEQSVEAEDPEPEIPELEREVEEADLAAGDEFPVETSSEEKALEEEVAVISEIAAEADPVMPSVDEIVGSPEDHPKTGDDNEESLGEAPVRE